MNKMEEEEIRRVNKIADVEGLIQVHKLLLDEGIITPEKYRESIRE